MAFPLEGEGWVTWIPSTLPHQVPEPQRFSDSASTFMASLLGQETWSREARGKDRKGSKEPDAQCHQPTSSALRETGSSVFTTTQSNDWGRCTMTEVFFRKLWKPQFRIARRARENAKEVKRKYVKGWARISTPGSRVSLLTLKAAGWTNSPL